MDHVEWIALDIVESRARASRVLDFERIRTAAKLHQGLDIDVMAATVARWSSSVRQTSRLTLNFHPDRISRDGSTVAEGMLRSGRYLPQSETGLSNGGRSAVPGGDRTRWERRLFGDAYERAGTGRPVYGALDLTKDQHGGSPRFGSCFVILGEGCFDRATLCVGDSHIGPTDVGTLAEFHAVAAGLLEQGTTGSGLDRGLGVEQLTELLEQGASTTQTARSLDGYVEAQIHGGVSLDEHVEAIVADPSFRNTEIEQLLGAAATAYRFDLAWHAGSVIHVDEVSQHFNTAQVPAIAAQVASPDGLIDAAALGRWAAARIPYSPPTLQGDPPDSNLQLVKYLWHCLLRTGRPAS